jgi:YidC/Oxa1 family membrane protein insertase
VPAADPSEAVAGGKAVALVGRVLPYLTLVIAAFAPLAAAIYLLTTTAWTLAERRLFLRRVARPQADTDGGGGRRSVATAG